MSWNAAHIAVKATRVSDKMDFVFSAAVTNLVTAVANWRDRRVVTNILKGTHESVLERCSYRRESDEGV